MSKDIMPDAYIPVSEESLKEGMILDRPLYIYLQSNNKYICIANALQPLDARTLSKCRKSGKVFSTQPSSAERYPEINEFATAIRQLCDDADKASFEKNVMIFQQLGNVLKKTFRDMGAGLPMGARLMLSDPTFATLFVQRTFGVPVPETMQHLEGLSVTVFEKSLRRAGVAAIFALMLGYNETKFLQQYIVAVFCEEARVLSAGSGAIPGLPELDLRFDAIMRTEKTPALVGEFNDELADLVAYIRWLVDVEMGVEGSVKVKYEMPRVRVFKKLKNQFEAFFGKDTTFEVAA